MGHRPPLLLDSNWSFSRLLDEVFAYYRGSGPDSIGRRLTLIRNWLAMVGRDRAIESIKSLERQADGATDAEIAESLWMSESSYRNLKRWVKKLPEPTPTPAPTAFISYKWDSGEHVAWVRQFAGDLRSRGIAAILDQWEVKLGESFTEYMQRHIAEADVILFVITKGAVAAAEAPAGEGGALKFEVQMMNARRMAEGVRIIGVYRSGDRPPHYLRDNRYADFRNDDQYQESLTSLVDDLLGKGNAPPVGSPAPSVLSANNAPTVRVPVATKATAAEPFTKARLESLLHGNPSRDLEITNGLWARDVTLGTARRIRAQGPVRTGHIDADFFEARIPYEHLWGLSLPYSLVRASWITTDAKLALHLSARPVLYEDGFHLETSDA